MLREFKSPEERRIERGGPPHVAPARSTFPDDAVALIYEPARSAMTSGTPRTRQWKLRFERRSPQFIEPLMGWTGGEDTLSQVELTFPSVESALAYARRQGLKFVVQGAGGCDPELRLVSDNSPAEHSGGLAARSGMSHRSQLEWLEQTLGGEGKRSGDGSRHPAADYACPKDVLADSRLLPEHKRELLRRWALDELPQSGGQAQSSSSRVDEVIDAILDLDEMQGSILPHRSIPMVSTLEARAA